MTVQTAHIERASGTARQRCQAWAAHGFTALGIVAAMLALRDVLTDHPESAILWLLLTLVIDGVDGPVARAVMVEQRAPRIDGYTLDLIIDYVTCVIVPACFMYQFEVVPHNNLGIAVLCVLVFTSAIWFARRDMETPEFWFRGFPAAWNMAAPVMFVLEARMSTGVVVTLVLSVFSLTNMPYPHILRAKFLRPYTVVAAVLLMSGMVLGTLTYPDHSALTRALLILGCAYFAALSVLKWTIDIRTNRADSGKNGLIDNPPGYPDLHRS